MVVVVVVAAGVGQFLTGPAAISASGSLYNAGRASGWTLETEGKLSSFLSAGGSSVRIDMNMR